MSEILDSGEVSTDTTFSSASIDTVRKSVSQDYKRLPREERKYISDVVHIPANFRIQAYKVFSVSEQQHLAYWLHMLLVLNSGIHPMTLAKLEVKKHRYSVSLLKSRGVQRTKILFAGPDSHSCGVTIPKC